MATIETAVEKLQDLILKSPIANEYKKDIAEVISLLTDKTVLFIEWNSVDFQQAAREKLALMDNVKEVDIIDEPLTKEMLENLVTLLDDYYDAGEGVTYETISNLLDHVSLPDTESARKRVKVILEVRSDYLMNIIAPIVKQMSAAGREADALKMIQEINAVGRYFDALEIVAKYVDIEYTDTK